MDGLDAFLAASGPRGLAGISDVTERRAKFAELMAAGGAAEQTGIRIETEDLQIPGPAGAPKVTVRVYRPADQSGPLPALLYIHGGGMVIGSHETEDPITRRLAAEVNCVAVSVDYRLAPEHRHPAAVEDCFAALQWMTGNASSLALDAGRISVYGGSAGGLLAAATALLARDRGGPQPAFQMLLYPMLDDRCHTPSCREIQDIGIWDGWAHREAYEALLGSDLAADAYAAPARAGDLSGLPPAYIDVGELDALRDESIEYASRLMGAGVPTELHVYPGAYHGWEIFGPDAEVSVRVIKDRVRALRSALHAGPRN
jgi:acetyl esterase/lipase